MIKIAICDDEKEIVNLVKKYIDNVTSELEKVVSVIPYIDWKNMEYDLSEGEVYDIIFMDIEYGNVNGIQLVEQIKGKYPTTNIIFITGHHEFVFDVFAVQPFGFLRKPIDFEEFKKVFVGAMEKSQMVEMFEYVYNRITYKLPLNEVIWFNSDGRKIHIKTIKEDREFYGKLDDIEGRVHLLNDGFLRIAHSYLVNSEFVSSIAHNVITVNLGSKKEELKIAETYRDGIKRRYMSNWEEL